MHRSLIAPAEAEALVAWGRENLRDLPWRRTRDPWAVLVSEVMAQQTQVARVVPKWEAFMAAYPTAAACAAAPLGDVLRLWQGLGYPRRARNLYLAAQAIAAATFPTVLEGLLALPGVGPYTARAVLAFAYEADAAVVDTNVARVLARIVGRPLGAREVQHVADAALPAGRAWVWNQALMELGSTLCTARSAHCAVCPLSPSCVWSGLGGASAPDPAVGTAGVSARQPRFAGSDRQARGRILAAAALGPLDASPAALASVAGVQDADRAQRLAASLVADGLLARRESGTLTLPS